MLEAMRRWGLLATRWHGPLVGAVFVAAILGLLGPALLSDRVLGGEDFLLFGTPFDSVRPASVERPSNTFLYDAVYVFHPDMLDAREQLRSGHLPGWSENLGGGRPLLASQQHAILYPPNLLTVLLPFWDGLELAAALKLLIAAVGTYLLCVGLGVRRLAATLGGLAFALSGGVVLWLEHPHANVYALAPWLLLFTDRLVRGRRPTAALGLAATVGLAILGGHPQSLFLVMALGVVPIAIFGLAGQRSPSGRRDARRALRSTSLLAGAIALGILSGAVMLWPFLEALGQASGSGARGGAGLPRPALNAFFFPELWGRPDEAEIPGGPINFPERTYYFGVLPLALAVGSLVAGRLRTVLPFLTVGLLGLAVGIANPVSTLVKQLPGFASTNQYRSLVLCSLAGAVLAAFALDRLLDPAARQRRRILIVTGAWWLFESPVA